MTRGVVTDIQDAAGAQVVKDISGSGGRASYIHLDVASQPEWEAAVAAQSSGGSTFW